MGVILSGAKDLIVMRCFASLNMTIRQEDKQFCAPRKKQIGDDIHEGGIDE